MSRASLVDCNRQRPSTRTSSSTSTIRRRQDEFEPTIRRVSNDRVGPVKEYSCASWDAQPTGRRVDLRKPLSSGPLSLLAIVPIIVLEVVLVEFSSACSFYRLPFSQITNSSQPEL